MLTLRQFLRTIGVHKPGGSMSKTPTLERRAAEIAGTEGDADDVELAALEHLRAVEAETVEWCARIVERHKPGWTSSLDEDGGLIRDPDGPWGLGEDFASAIRSANK